MGTTAALLLIFGPRDPCQTDDDRGERGGRDNDAGGDYSYYYFIIIIVVVIISIDGGLDHTPLSRLANSYRLERDRDGS